ncbi:MOP flippase family protein [Fibrella aquatilis]|uniref:MOP flippase family protein n=1 Tax=Fibrella aquatilis TaxID=2817059 RepID=A0A939JUS7_9BACT|nr:MOP flippase family protein [Fibrella aquatilis]MBO0930097.1 MOP flippase family protein [Fibrella aquatilis]
MSSTNAAMNGGKWITIATVVSTVLQFAQIAVLTRLLTPAAFGLVSVSSLIITFFQLFTNLGFSNSIIYKQESDRTVLSTLYFLNLLVGLVIFAAVQLSTPAIAAFYNQPKLDRVLHLSSIYFLIVYFGQIYLFLMEKELRFRSIASIEIIGAVVGTITTVALAYSGYHELSLIIGQLVMQLVKTTGQIMLGRGLFKPLLSFSLAEAKDHLRFGLYNLGDGLLGFVQSNSDNILIGKMLGVEMLGYYTIAYQLAIFPITKLNPIILQVAYPILAKMQGNNAELKRAYLKILDILSYCNMPLLAGLFVTAESVVPLVYGPGWEKTIELIHIFVFVGLFMCLSHPLFTLAFTKGKPNLLFYLNLVTLVMKIPLVYFLGQYYGVIGIATAFLLATLFNLLANFAIVHYLIGDFMGTFLKNIVRPTVFCLLMVSAVTAYKAVFGHEGSINTIAEIALGGAIYAGLTLAFKLSIQELKTYREAL